MNSRVLLLALLASIAPAQTFQVVFVETPVVSGGGQPVERFLAAGTNGALTRLSDIPGSLLNDPASVVFDNNLRLFIGNRAAHSGNGTISMFTFDPGFGTFMPAPTISGNDLTDVHGMAFNPVDGELFAANWSSGRLSRFRFDPAGNPIANGHVQMPDGDNQLGVAVRAVDQQLFVSHYSFVRRFARGPGGSYSHIGNFTIPGAGGIHYLKMLLDELFVCDISTNAVYRFTFDAGGNPIANGSISVASPIDVAFSPDRREMFVSRHHAGGFARFLFDPQTNTWNPTTVQTGPQGGGIATSVHWYSEYGSGCAGTGGQIPRLSGLGIPSPGNTINLRLQLGLPGALGTFVLSVAPGTVPLAGCTWLQSGVIGNTALFVLDATGAHTFPIPLPPTLLPLDSYFQGFLLDPGSANGLFSATNGLRASVQ